VFEQGAAVGSLRFEAGRRLFGPAKALALRRYSKPSEASLLGAGCQRGQGVDRRGQSKGKAASVREPERGPGFLLLNATGGCRLHLELQVKRCLVGCVAAAGAGGGRGKAAGLVEEQEGRTP